jgi:hypothetical protein
VHAAWIRPRSYWKSTRGLTTIPNPMTGTIRSSAISKHISTSLIR